jgi:hypothetical protein
MNTDNPRWGNPNLPRAGVRSAEIADPMSLLARFKRLSLKDFAC